VNVNSVKKMTLDQLAGIASSLCRTWQYQDVWSSGERKFFLFHIRNYYSWNARYYSHQL